LLYQKIRALSKLNRTEEAINLVRSLIRKDPNNEEYWLLLFQVNPSDPRALFKAYNINPGHPYILTSLMSHHLEQKDFSSLFSCIQLTQQVQHKHPLLISLLALLNCIVGFETDSEEHLLEAVILLFNFSLQFENKTEIRLIRPQMR